VSATGASVADASGSDNTSVDTVLGEYTMANTAEPTGSARTDDPYDLNRFLQAQETDFARALSEVKSGRKRTHWMWYIFPQLDGLAFSETARYYAIKSLDEARAYLEHAVLGARLRECAEAALGVEGRSAREVFGSPDDLKLRSCATLFAWISPPDSVFERLLAKYYGDQRDEKTSRLLGISPEASSGPH
jgi:uncharacterized protein (DUF1810 family)